MGLMFLYLLTDGLFNDAASSADCIALSSRMMSNELGKDLEGSGHGIFVIEDTIRALPRATEKNYESPQVTIACVPVKIRTGYLPTTR
jgi:hypothetical protein